MHLEQFEKEINSIGLPLDVVVNTDCLRAMAMMPSNSVDMILCDLPYG